MIEKGYGTSVRGKLHKKNKIPNQDSYVIINNKNYTLAVVCDGLGSKKYSHIASRRLCRLISKEIKKIGKNIIKPYNLVKSIQDKYKKIIWPFSLKNSDTTCLFTLISRKNILMFQLGDGFNLVVEDDTLIMCDTIEKDFTNETKAFGKSSPYDWKFKVINKKENSTYKYLLCTDGISEDLIEDVLVDFVNDLVSNVNGKNKNNKILKEILLNWPNKNSNDDKTIVVVK